MKNRRDNRRSCPFAIASSSRCSHQRTAPVRGQTNYSEKRSPSSQKRSSINSHHPPVSLSRVFRPNMGVDLFFFSRYRSFSSCSLLESKTAPQWCWIGWRLDTTPKWPPPSLTVIDARLQGEADRRKDGKGQRRRKGSYQIKLPASRASHQVSAFQQFCLQKKRNSDKKHTHWTVNTAFCSLNWISWFA